MTGSGGASAGLRRLACKRCFDRKQKCDRALPSCSACSSLGVHCEDRPWPFKPTDDTFAVKHASVLSYVESLKHKIHDLGTGCPERPGKRARTSTNRHSSTAPSTRLHHGTTTRNGAVSLGRSVSSKDGNSPSHHRSPSTRDTMGEIGFLSRSAMAEPRVEYMESSRNLNLNLYKMIMAALALDSSDHSIAGGHRLKSQISATPNADSLSKFDREGTIGYMNQFSNTICLQYPFLSIEDSMVQYDTVLAALSGCSSDHRVIDERGLQLEYFNTCLSIALGGLLSPDASQLASFISALHSAARRTLPVILQNQDSLLAIKCMLMLAMYSLYSPSGGSAWHLIGMVMQKCVALGLEKDQDVQGSLANERVKVFWSAYMLDRSVSLIMGRPFSVQDEDITLQTPLINETKDDDQLGASLKQHLITQARLASHIHSNPSQSSIIHYHNIAFWREVPTSLRHLPEKHKHILDHLEHLACRMLMQLTRHYAILPSITSPSYAEQQWGLGEEIELNILTSCKRFVDKCYDKVGDSSGFHSSFLDVTDVFQACAVYVTLIKRRQAVGQIWIMDASEILQKGLLLMTVGGGAKFSAARIFHKALLAISGTLVRNSPASNPARHDEMYASLRRLVPSDVYHLATQLMS